MISNSLNKTESYIWLLWVLFCHRILNLNELSIKNKIRKYLCQCRAVVSLNHGLGSARSDVNSKVRQFPHSCFIGFSNRFILGRLSLSLGSLMIGYGLQPVSGVQPYLQIDFSSNDGFKCTYKFIYKVQFICYWNHCRVLIGTKQSSILTVNC